MTASLQAQSVTLLWDPNPEPDVVGYHLYRSQRSGGGYVRLTSTPVQATRYTDRTVQPGATYFYVCTAVNIALLESGYSNEVTVTIPQPPPFNPPPSDPPTDPPSEPAEEPPEPAGKSVVVPVRTWDWGPWFKDTFVGVGLLGYADALTSVRVEAQDQSGRPLVSPLARLSLYPRQQRAFLASELRPPAGTAWLEVEGAESSLVMVGDQRLERLDALPAMVADTDLLLADVSVREESSGLLMVGNPSSAAPARVKLIWTDKEGQGRAYQELTLLPGQGLARRFEELVPAALAGREGWLRIAADRPVTAAALQADSSAISGIGALPAQTLSRLYAPHFAVGPGAGTSVVTLLSADSTASAGVEVRLLDDGGNTLARKDLVLPRLGSVTLDLGTLPAARGAELLSGTVEVTALGLVGLRMAGWLHLRGADGETATVMPLSPEGRRRMVFPHVAQAADGSISSGLVIFNPGSQPASIWLEAWDSAGRWRAGRDLTVPPGRRLVGLLSSESLFGPEFQMVGGHLRLWSSAPVIAFAAFGDGESTFLSAVEAR